MEANQPTSQAKQERTTLLFLDLIKLNHTRVFILKDYKNLRVSVFRETIPPVPVNQVQSEGLAQLITTSTSPDDIFTIPNDVRTINWIDCAVRVLSQNTFVDEIF